MKHHSVIWAGIVLVVCFPVINGAAEPEHSIVQRKIEEFQEKVLSMKTMGGRQFWVMYSFFKAGKYNKM